MILKRALSFLLVPVAASVLCSSALADDRTDLFNTVFSLSSMKGDFTQTVKNAENKVLQESTGEIMMSRPNLFRMEVKSPDESLLVADGRDVYSYDDMLEQVTIFDFNVQVNDSPLMLLITDKKEIWDRYDVKKQSKDSYLIKPLNQTGLVKQMSIQLKDNMVTSLTIVEKDNKSNTYTFSNVSADKLDAKLFSYTPAPGVTVDDQRSK